MISLPGVGKGGRTLLSQQVGSHTATILPLNRTKYIFSLSLAPRETPLPRACQELAHPIVPSENYVNNPHDGSLSALSVSSIGLHLIECIMYDIFFSNINTEKAPSVGYGHFLFLLRKQWAQLEKNEGPITAKFYPSGEPGKSTSVKSRLTD